MPFAAGVFQEKGDETRINLDAVIDGQLLQMFDALGEKLEQAEPEQQLPSPRDTQRARRTDSHEGEHAKLVLGFLHVGSRISEAHPHPARPHAAENSRSSCWLVNCCGFECGEPCALSLTRCDEHSHSHILVNRT